VIPRRNRRRLAGARHIMTRQVNKERIMHRIEQSIEVDRPVTTVYNQWTQFETFPVFMHGVTEVLQVDDTHLRWKAMLGGKDVEWDAEITEQEPDRRISWKSISGAHNAGTVRFRPLDMDRTEVRLVMAYETHTAYESLGRAIGVVDARVRQTLIDFKKFAESRAFETGGWRGEVVDGEAHEPPVVHPAVGWRMPR
jgi:uncharacterized membrane protein